MTGVYPASSIKRKRATKAEVGNRRRELFDIVQEMYPMSVRGADHQATVRSLVEKTEGGYDKVQHDLVLMRRAGDLPYGWITDNTRWQRKPRTFGSIDEALDDTLRLYRKSLWADADCYVEIWLEKDALAGVILPVTSEYDVPLMVARGYASLSFLHEAAEVHQRTRRADLHLSLGRLRSLGRQCRRDNRTVPARTGAECSDHVQTARCHTAADRQVEFTDAADEAQRQPIEGVRRYLG